MIVLKRPYRLAPTHTCCIRSYSNMPLRIRSATSIADGRVTVQARRDFHWLTYRELDALGVMTKPFDVKL